MSRSKRKNYSIERRRIRRMEKRVNEATPTQDKSIGKACRRGWGSGKPLDNPLPNIS